MIRSQVSPGRLGHDFEDRVRRAFERSGFLLIKKNDWRENYARERDHAAKREYDLMMFNTHECQFYIIECKAHYSANSLVNLGLVKVFSDKLDRYDGSWARRMMVSDTDFTQSAREYAKSRDIMTIGGSDLQRLESNMLGAVSGFAMKKIYSSLESHFLGFFRSYINRRGGA